MTVLQYQKYSYRNHISILNQSIWLEHNRKFIIFSEFLCWKVSLGDIDAVEFAVKQTWQNSEIWHDGRQLHALPPGSPRVGSIFTCLGPVAWNSCPQKLQELSMIFVGLFVTKFYKPQTSLNKYKNIFQCQTPTCVNTEVQNSSILQSQQRGGGGILTCDNA